MPRVAMDYSKTVIYHFVCQDKTITCSYVGSTTNFIKRKNQHKTVCYNEKRHEYTFLLYQTIRDNGGWTNWTMMPLEEYPCENSIQQRIREQYWIDKLKPELNCVKAYSSEEERIQKYKETIKKYRETHKDILKEQLKKYRETHKEKLEEYTRIYRETNREKINEKQRAFREENKEQLKEKRDKYREANRDKINKQKRELYKALKSQSTIDEPSSC